MVKKQLDKSKNMLLRILRSFMGGINLDRNIVTIRYNLLNLPDTIQFKNGRQIINRYDATGQKLSTMYVTPIYPLSAPLTAGATISTDNSSFRRYGTLYNANMEYTLAYNGNRTLVRIHNAEGYALPSNVMFYHRKDHLGSIRSLWSTNYNYDDRYYPSGLPWSNDTGYDVGPYKYNGKEFIETHGLDEYDSQARWYYPAIMRTTTMDPHAENYYNISPYAWCGNNPVNVIDPDGRRLLIAGTKEYNKQVMNDLKQLAKDNPEVKKMITDLIKSPNTHLIEMPKDNDGYNYITFNERKAEDGIAQGSKVGYDPNRKDTKSEKERTPRVGLAHELKHSSDIDKGKMDMETKTETGVPVREVDAVNIENKIREKTGDKKRTTYGGKNISEIWLDN